MYQKMNVFHYVFLNIVSEDCEIPPDPIELQLLLLTFSK